MEKDTTRTGGSISITAPFIGSEAPIISATFLGVNDEYDPLNPNDYEEHVKVVKDKRQKERDEERQRELEDREK